MDYFHVEMQLSLYFKRPFETTRIPVKSRMQTSTFCKLQMVPTGSGAICHLSFSRTCDMMGASVIWEVPEVL